MSYRVKSGVLLLESKESQNQVSIFFAEPTPLQKKDFGDLLILIEIENGDPKFREVIHLIEQEIRNRYYGSVEMDPELALENALTLTNQKLREVIAELGESWLAHLNVLVATLHHLQLSIASVGQVKAYLAQGNRIVDILQNTGPRGKKINPLKIFSSLVNGNIHEENTLIFSTENLLDYFSLEKIRRTVLEHTPEKSVQCFEESLREASPFSSLAAFVMRSEKVEEPVPQETFSRKSLSFQADSMHDLVQKERSTHDILEPKMWPKIRPSNTLNHTIWKKSWEISKKISSFLLAGSGVLLRWIISFFRKKPDYRKSLRALPQKTTSRIVDFIIWFRRLSRPRKILLVLAVFLFVFVSQSIVRKGFQKESKETLVQYEQTITDTEKKINDAKAKLLMKDERGAREAAGEAKNLLASVPETSSIFKQNGANFLSQIQDIFSQINHEEEVSPETVQDFQTSLTKFVFFGINLYGFSSSGSVFSTQGNIVKVAQNLVSITKDTEGTVLALFASGNFGQFNPVLEKYSDVTVNFTNQDRNIVDAEVFTSRLYTLDAKNNQIFKHLNDGDNFGQGTTWITDSNINVKNAIDMAIDGSIFVLKDNGDIIKLFAGTKTNWVPTTLENPLKATKIFTNENTSILYAVDKENKRIVAFNKETGDLIKQYTSSSFEDLQDVLANDSEKNIYTLSGSKILKFAE